MDAQFKTKWIAALRSGKYAQCRDELTNGWSFCCIGVGYEIMGKASNEIQGQSDDNPKADDATYVAAKAIGLSKKDRDTLIVMNDGSPNTPPRSFPEIADYIEQNL